MTTLVTNVPKREESRAKRHFVKSEINNVQRWKCNYCVTNYGLTTSTSSLWKHLEHKHKEKLSSEDTKQKSGHEGVEKAGKCNIVAHNSDNPKFSSKHLSTNVVNNYEIDSSFEPVSSSSCSNYCDQVDSVVQQPSNLFYTDGRKRRCSNNASENELTVSKKCYAESTLISGGTRRDFIGGESSANATSYGFLNLVTDIATIQPSQFESFQDLLVQNVFLQQSGPYIFPNVDNVDVMRDRILSAQRNRVIDIVGQQCGWKFDMNLYPVFLKDKTYLILDLIYRNKKQLHQSCFLDCLEMPDKYPTELLSVMIFRRLCEFRVENRLWQLFIGDASLKGLAETLRKIFIANNLTDELVYETVDFFNHKFTVPAEEHNDCLNDLIRKVEECVIQLEALKMNLSTADASNQLLLYGARQRSSMLPTSTQCGTVVTPENMAQIEDQLESLRISGGHFQKDMTSIRWWYKRHLFLAYHLCNHCYYLCSDIQKYRTVVDELSVQLDLLANALTSRDVKREEWLSPADLQNRLSHWKEVLLWWKRKSQEYQELRHTVLNFVSSNDNTSIFTQTFTKMSQASSQLIPNERWMNYTFWQIWKNFEKNDVGK